MNTKFKQQVLLLVIAAALAFIVMNLHTVLGGAYKTILLLLPIFIGGMVAFILNVPATGFDNLLRRFFKSKKRKPSDKKLWIISTLLALISILLVVALVCTVTVPAVVASMRSVYSILQEKLPAWISMLQDYNIDISGINEWIKMLDIQNLTSKVTSNVGVFLNTVAGAAMSTISGVSTGAVSAIIAIYILLNKRELSAQVNKLMNAYLKQTVVDKILNVARLSRSTYSKFLSGQCVEACILGVLMFIVFSLFRLPYASLVGLLSGFCAFIPYIGAFAACAIGAFLTFIAAPAKVLLCIIVYLVVQFIENQFIYPHVVGNSVGLSPLWTLIAVFVGAQLMGVIGIIFFIPLTSVVYTLISDMVNKRVIKNAAGNDKADTSD